LFGNSSVATAQADVFSKNGYTVPYKLAKILKIFDGLEELKNRDACFSTKKYNYHFLGYGYSFDSEPSCKPNQSHIDNSSTTNLLSEC
jgi:hypothetical protein